MKKGIVMEKRRRYMIVMTRNGIFQKAAPMNNSAIGEEVYFKPIASSKWLSFFFYPKKNRRTPVRIIAMVCMLLVIAMPFYFIMGKDKTYAYVNIDINPSVELKIDDNLRVYAVTPLNEDANKIVKKLTHYKNEDVEKVIGMIMSRSEEAGLINQGKNMLVGVSFIKDESRASDLINRLRRHLSRDKASWEIVAFQVPKKTREKAKEKNKSMNETMATEIIDGKKDVVNKEEKAIIESFYHTKDNQKQQERPDNPDKNEKTNKTQPGKQDNIEQDTTTTQKNKANKQEQHKQKENNNEKNPGKSKDKNQPNKKDINKKKNKNVKPGNHNHKHNYKNKEIKKKKRHKKHNEKHESKHHHHKQHGQNNKHKQPKHNQNKHNKHKHNQQNHNQNKHNKHNNGRSHH